MFVSYLWRASLAAGHSLKHACRYKTRPLKGATVKDDKKKAETTEVEEEVVVVEEEKLSEEDLDKASGGFYPWRPTEKGGKKYPRLPEFPD